MSWTSWTCFEMAGSIQNVHQNFWKKTWTSWHIPTSLQISTFPSWRLKHLHSIPAHTTRLQPHQVVVSQRCVAGPPPPLRGPQRDVEPPWRRRWTVAAVAFFLFSLRIPWKRQRTLHFISCFVLGKMKMTWHNCQFLKKISCIHSSYFLSLSITLLDLSKINLLYGTSIEQVLCGVASPQTSLTRESPPPRLVSKQVLDVNRPVPRRCSPNSHRLSHSPNIIGIIGQENNWRHTLFSRFKLLRSLEHQVLKIWLRQCHATSRCTRSPNCHSRPLWRPWPSSVLMTSVL